MTAFITLCRELWFKRPPQSKTDPNVLYDDLDRLRYLEVELCKTLGFNLMVHNPLSLIHHVRYQLLERFRENHAMLVKLKDPKQYGKFLELSESIAMLQFKSEKLTFCFKPNIVGLAALQVSFKKCVQPTDEEPLAPLMLQLLGIDQS